MRTLLLAIVSASAVAGCISGIDPQWQLDHDRIAVVRANPPHIPSGATATFDALISHKGAPTDVEQPLFGSAFDPADLASAVTMDPTTGQLTVTAPDEATLDRERASLGLDAGAPVPLQVAMEFPESNGISLPATKIVYLGDSVDNASSVGNPTLDGMPIPASITIPIDVDVPLGIDADPAAKVDWLTSCGTMHDYDEHAAFIHVQPKDPKSGELVVVVRAVDGGVAWQVWPIVAQ